MSIRTERVGEEIKKVLSERMIRGLRDPLPGFVTVSRVAVTADFSQAKIFVSVIGSDAEKKSALEVLHRSRGMLRAEVGKKIRLRQTPELVFFLDEIGEKAAQVWKILEREDAKRSAASPTSPLIAAASPAQPESFALQQGSARQKPSRHEAEEKRK